MANQVALPVPTELRDRREDAASGATCPIHFRDTGYAGGYAQFPISKPKESFCPHSCLFRMQTPGT